MSTTISDLQYDQILDAFGESELHDNIVDHISPRTTKLGLKLRFMPAVTQFIQQQVPTAALADAQKLAGNILTDKLEQFQS